MKRLLAVLCLTLAGCANCDPTALNQAMLGIVLLQGPSVLVTPQLPPPPINVQCRSYGNYTNCNTY